MRRNMVAGILNQNVPNPNVPSMSGNVSNYSMMGPGGVQATPSHFDNNKRKKLREMIFGVK